MNSIYSEVAQGGSISSLFGLHPRAAAPPQWIYLTQRFTTFIANITITDSQFEDGTRKQAGIRACLNRYYWNSSSEAEHSMLIGSWGKHTHVRPSRDVDILFLLPASVFHRFQERAGNRQSQLLQEIKTVLANTYSQTTVRGDGQVVAVPFNTTPIEISPGFRCSDGTIIVCDANNGGRYVTSTAEAEAASLASSDLATGGNTRKLARMFKQWQRTCNVPLKSFLIERLAAEFLASYGHARQSYFYYDWMARDFLGYLIRRANTTLVMPGTGDRIPLGDAWLSRARSAYEQSLKACEYERANSNMLAGLYWQDIFGTHIPSDAS